jgi:methylglutamate dehydrogenase subunit D
VGDEEESTLEPRDESTEVHRASRSLRADACSAIERREHTGLAIVVARRGQRDQLERVLREQFSIDAPTASQMVTGTLFGLIGSGPDQWLAISSALEGSALAAKLRLSLAGLASITDQSDARAIFRLRGRGALKVLAKGCPLDLHARAFAPGDAALTVIHHMSVQLWQLDAVPTFELSVPRSFAWSFAHWLADAKIGIEAT